MFGVHSLKYKLHVKTAGAINFSKTHLYAARIICQQTSTQVEQTTATIQSKWVHQMGKSNSFSKLHINHFSYI